MERSEKLAILASIMHLSAYAVYNTTALRGGNQPNLVPWAIWGVMSVLNTLTYKRQTGDAIKAMLSFTGCVAAIATFVVALAMDGGFRSMSKIDTIALCAGILAIVVWKLGSVKYANFCVIAGVTAGFIPFYKVLWHNPHAERPLAWILWVFATGLGVVVVAMRPESRKKSDFIQPAIFWLLHASVLVLIIRPF